LDDIMYVDQDMFRHLARMPARHAIVPNTPVHA
jgi:hypothetical protein